MPSTYRTRHDAAQQKAAAQDKKQKDAARREVRSALIQAQLDLVSAVYGQGTITLRAKCDMCTHVFTPLEIMDGFSLNTMVSETVCPTCGQHAVAYIKRSTLSSGTEDVCFSPAYTLERLHALAGRPLEEIQARYTATYASALVHYGGLGQAFARIGFRRPNNAPHAWQRVAAPFLGKMPDSMMADLVGTHVHNIAKFRRLKCIPTYRQQREIRMRQQQPLQKTA